jgi:hypothetical protein
VKKSRISQRVSSLDPAAIYRCRSLVQKKGARPAGLGEGLIDGLQIRQASVAWLSARSSQGNRFEFFVIVGITKVFHVPGFHFETPDIWVQIAAGFEAVLAPNLGAG